MKYAVIIFPPFVLVLALICGGEALLDREDAALSAAEPPVSPTPEPVPETPVPETPVPVVAAPAPAPAPLAVATPAPAAEEADDAPPALVPPDLATPLRAVAPDVSLCIPASLERDKGPLDVEVHFTPTPGGAFAEGTEVETSWDDDEHTISHCIAEVFDETSFWPSPPVRFSRAVFVFHFPDDAMRGLLGMHYSPFQ